MPRAGRASRRERGLLAALALTLAAFLGWQNGLGRLDYAVYDGMAVLLAPAPDPGIVVVAIDEASLSEHGRWPWDRRLLADLIERISADAPAAIALDVLLPEASADPAADAELAGALSRSQRVVLPVFSGPDHAGGVQSLLPIRIFCDRAAHLGHVSVTPDEDGVLREVFLTGGDPLQPWEHMSVAMLRVAGQRPEVLPGALAPAEPLAAESVSHWHQDHGMRIAYPSRHKARSVFSAANVLAGEVPVDAFAQKFVLIGITASGLGDIFPTPLTGEGSYAPGVMILAAILDNVMHGPQWRNATPDTTTLFTLAAVGLLLFVLLRNTPAGALVTTVVFCALVLLISLTALSVAGIWVPPGAALVVCLMVYPLWSWRRLEAASAYMAEELRRLQREEAVLPYGIDEPVDGGDLVERRIEAMTRATSHLRALNAFIGASIDSLPDITLVADRHGCVVLANQAAADYFERPRARLRGLPVALLVAPLRARSAGGVRLEAGEDIECRDQAGREFLLKYSQFQGLPDFATIGIISLIDVMRLRQAERTRDEALRFLSHDLRAPLSAIQAIVAMPVSAAQSYAAREARIARLAVQAQGLAEDFVQLARAESSPMRHDPLDYGDVVLDAIDACWGLAQARMTEIVFTPPDAAPGRGDADMLRRAVVNLLTNAIKYGPASARVVVSLLPVGPRWYLAVRDEGPGIDPQLQATLFEPFARAPDAGAASVGLGLAYVRAAVTRHGGSVSLSSEPGRGSTFILHLPAESEDAARTTPDVGPVAAA